MKRRLAVALCVVMMTAEAGALNDAPATAATAAASAAPPPPTTPAAAPTAPKPWPSVPLPALEGDPVGSVHASSWIVGIVGNHVSEVLAVSTEGDIPALLLRSSLFGWSGPASPYPDRHFPELQIRVDGAPARLEEGFEAFAGRRNVTNMLRSLAMDPWAVTRTPPYTTAAAENAPLLRAFVTVGAVEKSGDGYLAKWQARRVVRIPLAPESPHRVELNYEGRPAVALLKSGELDTAARERTYCLSTSELRHLPPAPAGGPWLAVSEFTLPLGIDQVAPQAVTLSWSAAGAERKGLLFFCGPHGKGLVKRGAFSHESAAVDETGTVHVLRVAESAERPTP
jgi:hypothetical protein